MSGMLAGTGGNLLKLAHPCADASRSMRVGATTPRTQLAVAACVAIVTALSLTGCGSSAVATGPLARAADVTAAAGGAQMAMKLEIGTGASSPVAMTGNGRFNFKGFEGTMSLEMSGLPESEGTPSGSLSLTEIVKLPDVYIQSPALTSKLPGGAQWVKLDLQHAIGEGLGINLQAEASQENPAEYLDYLRATGTAVTVVGHESVRGVPTTHYRGTIDLEKAAELVPSTDRAKLRSTFAQLRTLTGGTSLPIDVWVDSSHRVRRFAIEYAMTIKGEHAHSAVTIEYFDFGPQPPVSAPPENQVFDATQSALGGSSSGG